LQIARETAEKTGSAGNRALGAGGSFKAMLEGLS